MKESVFFPTQAESEETETQEELQDSHVQQEQIGGKDVWTLRLGAREKIIVPEPIALFIRDAMTAESERIFDERIDQMLENINCHKAVLYPLGFISKDELLQDRNPNTHPEYHFTNDARKLSRKEFKPTGDGFDAEALAGDVCKEGEICIGQMETANGYLHSFLIGKTLEPPPSNIVGQRPPAQFICFEKVDFEKEPFQEISLRDLSKRYPDGKWRFFPVADAKNPKAA